MNRPKVVPSFRIGDLVWCRERSNTKLWWPAMVTYEPKLGIYFRSHGDRVSQYHVQYFGIAAVRGWVFPQAVQEVNDTQEKPAPAKGVGKKLQAEYEVAMRELSEAFPLNHKLRKLKFIFDFGPPSPKPQPKQTKPKPTTTLPISIPLPGKAFGAKSYRQPKPESQPTLTRRGLKASPSQLLESPSLSSSQSSIPEAVQRPTRAVRLTKRARLSDASSQSGDIEAAPPAKRQVLDSHAPGLCDNSSEVSAPSIASAILTPPSSCSEETPPVNFEFEQSEKEVQKSRELQAPKAIKGKPKSDKLTALVKGTCSICDDTDTNLLLCKGQCYRTFHLDCLGLMQIPDFTFVCDECLTSRNECFLCKKSDGELHSCNKPKCTKVYHLSCIEDNKLFTVDKRSAKNFTCALHFCARCTSIGTSHVNHYNLIQCIKCPLAFHRPDCFIAGCEIIDPTHMICYQHLKIERNVSLYSHLNINTCLECGEAGTLFCCDICSAAYHMLCLDEESRPSEEAKSWSCPSCVVHDLPTYGSMVLCKFSTWRWWPGEVVLPNAIPDNLVPKKTGQCMFVVRFCGSNDYCWTYHGRTLPYTIEEGADEAKGKKRKGWSPKKSRYSSSNNLFQKALVEAEELYQSKQAAREARKKPESKHFYKIKSNKYLVPRPQSIKEWRSISCQCTPENPCNDDSTCVNRAIYVECDPETCPVGKLCQNQRILKCQNADTVPFYTGNRGWGLKPTHDVSEGDFVVEYVGEILDVKMCRERLMKYHENNTTNFYMLTLDTGLVIDASQKSNHARFMNHSCDPNCETQKWTVHGEMRIGIFARTDIPAGTELTFDYHLDSLGNDKKRCLCGSKNCSGFLGLKSKVEPQRSNPQTKKEQGKGGRKKKMDSRRKPNLKRPMKGPEPEVDRHENDCFVCGDGGDLLLCDNKGCPKAYHLACIGRKVFPPHHVTWECPRHYCQVCQKRAVTFCSSCPTSYCHKHNIARFTEVEGKIQCLENCINMDISTQPETEA